MTGDFIWTNDKFHVHSLVTKMHSKLTYFLKTKKLNLFFFFPPKKLYDLFQWANFLRVRATYHKFQMFESRKTWKIDPYVFVTYNNSTVTLNLRFKNQMGPQFISSK